MCAMKIKLNFQGIDTLFAELAPPERQAIHLLVSGNDKGNKISKLTAELVNIIAFLCKKLNWTEDEDENLIGKAEKEESKGEIVTDRNLADDAEDQEDENYPSTTLDTGNDSSPFDILQEENSSIAKATGEDTMKQSWLEQPDIGIEKKLDSDTAGHEKMEQIHNEEAEQSIIDPINSVLPFSCSYCHKKFRFKSKLKRHEITHTAEVLGISIGNSFSCPKCDKNLSSAKHLKSHERIHTGDLFSCNQCDKKFTRAEHLKRHEKMHI